MSMGNKWNGRKPVVDCTGDEIRTVQADRNEVDINKLVKRVEKGLGVPLYNGQPFYGDVSDFGGLQESLIKVQNARDLFMKYPASVRERFENDPVKFVEFMEDHGNLDEAIKLGLAVPRPKEPEGSKPPVPEQGANAQKTS